jgi:hypothetical protein
MDLDTVMRWEERLGIRRSVVLFITLWMTWRSFAWAAEYVSVVKTGDGLAAAAMIAAVTAPITYLQKVVFEAYIASKDLNR